MRIIININHILFIVMDSILAMLMGFIVVFFIIGIIFYVLFSYSLMKIAQKTKTDNAWLAWIPLVNIILMAQMAGKEWWWGLIALLIGLIPFIGGLISAGLIVYFFWNICEKLNKPAPLSLLMLIPFVNLIFVMYLGLSK